MGKRGKKGKGYSLKQIKGKMYCYVWDEWDEIESKKERKNGNKNYSRSHGWRSLGNWSKSETHEELKKFLQFKYGYDEHDLTEVFEKIEEEILIFNE